MTFTRVSNKCPQKWILTHTQHVYDNTLGQFLAKLCTTSMEEGFGGGGGKMRHVLDANRLRTLGLIIRLGDKGVARSSGMVAFSRKGVVQRWCDASTMPSGCLFGARLCRLLSALCSCLRLRFHAKMSNPLMPRDRHPTPVRAFNHLSFPLPTPKNHVLMTPSHRQRLGRLVRLTMPTPVCRSTTGDGFLGRACERWG